MAGVNTTNRNNKTTTRFCSFCGRNENQVNFLIPSPTGLYICDFCVDACEELIYSNLPQEKDIGSLTLDALPRPQDIKLILDQYVIGQERAKIALSVAVYNHYKRVLSSDLNKKGRRRSQRLKSQEKADDENEIELQKAMSC